MSVCQHCQQKLVTNEVAISFRLLGLEENAALCRRCLAAELKVPAELIDRKIEQFKEQGCPLFV